MTDGFNHGARRIRYKRRPLPPNKPGRKMFDDVTGFAMYEGNMAVNAYGDRVDTKTNLGFDNPDVRDYGGENP